jgi:zinc D-Ala-D-Ala carboxypeptidase
MKLSEHFNLSEFIQSDAAVRKGLDNTPSPEVVVNLTRVANVLELVRGHFAKPVKPSSGYRSPEVNKAIGGSKTSAHCAGLAADFRVDGVDNVTVCEWIRDNVSDYDQVIYEFGPTGWVHLGLAEKPRRQALTACKQNGKTVYLSGIKDLWRAAWDA